MSGDDKRWDRVADVLEVLGDAEPRPADIDWAAAWRRLFPKRPTLPRARVDRSRVRRARAWITGRRIAMLAVAVTAIWLCSRA